MDSEGVLVLASSIEGRRNIRLVGVCDVGEELVDQFRGPRNGKKEKKVPCLRNSFWFTFSFVLIVIVIVILRSL